MMIRPANTSFVLLFICFLFALLAFFIPDFVWLWIGCGVVFSFVALLDAWRVWQQPSPQIERQVAGSLALGVWSEVQLQVYNASQRDYQLHIFDGYPLACQLRGQPRVLELAAQTGLTVSYQLNPQQRGDLPFNGVYLSLRSPWGCWQQPRFMPLPKTVRVYPNFAAITKYALFATENRLGQLGIRKRQRRGEGLEFHQLREYQQGDVLRQVDWKATARYNKLISREYQEERDQQVIFLIDCGRRMLAKDGELSHFDHMLNAVLLLSYVALRQGDALGLMTFSGEARWLAPRKGVNTINLILNMVYDLQPCVQASDYLTAAHQLMQRHRRRALVVLISNLRDEDSSDLTPALALLRKKHLVLLASLQEQSLGEVLEAPIERFEDALRYAATHQYLQQRTQAHEQLAHQGGLYLDTTPAELPVRMVNRYLEIKRSGRL